jgi:hypothetical protein
MRRKIRKAIQTFKHRRLLIPRFEVRPTDCFVTSWPRSGNTWMRYLIFYALFDNNTTDLAVVEDNIPIVDRPDLKSMLERMESRPRRMFKSHEPFAPYYLPGRTAYIIRDGRDATLSLYNYRTQLNKLKMPLSEFIRRTINDEFDYGSWHKHVAGWIANDPHPNLLLIRYEDMLKDTPAQLKKLLTHFGVEIAPERITRAVELANIENVNKGFQKQAADKNRTFSGGLGGGSGKAKAAFSEDDTKLFMEHAGDLMRRLGYA